MHLDSEESVLSPVGSPRVSTDPVLGSSGLIDTPSDDGDLMVNHGPSVSLGEDSSGVGLELIGGVNTASDGSSLVDLSLHLVGSID